jgi:hypothetical protein
VPPKGRLTVVLGLGGLEGDILISRGTFYTGIKFDAPKRLSLVTPSESAMVMS